MMHNSTIELFCDHAALETERRAAELEITVDYYLEEFLDLDDEFINYSFQT